MSPRLYAVAHSLLTFITLTQRFGIHGIEFDMLVQEAIPEVLFLSRIRML
jgi:hypothetical protein